MKEPKHRILVVDDEPVIRLFLQELFEDEGYEVVTAQSIAEGLAALKLGGLNLVVTDKNLPDGTGFEIVHAAKEQDPPCEAMIVTGYASLDSAVMALQIGAYDYVLKPIEDVDLLLEKARKAIEKQDLWRELCALRVRVADAESAVAATASAASATASACGTASMEPASGDAARLEEIAGGLPQLMKLAELGSLLPMLAHEMRQPLAGVKGYVDLLLHKKDIAAPVRDKLVAMQEQLGHMAGLLDSLTSYSRVSRTGSTPIDLRRPIELALSIFPALRGKGRYDFACDLPQRLPLVRGNGNAIQQVVVNLVKNAKDAVDERSGGRIAISVAHDPARDELRLRVEDSGPGVPPEIQSRLFQPFFTTKQEGLGTGLGLTICKQIMAEHGGRIEVDSPLGPDGGSAFTLVFPAVREAVPAGALAAD